MSTTPVKPGMYLDLRRDQWRHTGWRALLFERSHDRIFEAQPVSFKLVEESDRCMEIQPTFTIGDAGIQSIMDNLWEQGVRPSRGVSSTGQLEATAKHLNDMRAIVAKYTKVKLP